MSMLVASAPTATANATVAYRSSLVARPPSARLRGLETVPWQPYVLYAAALGGIYLATRLDGARHPLMLTAGLGVLGFGTLLGLLMIRSTMTPGEA